MDPGRYWSDPDPTCDIKPDKIKIAAKAKGCGDPPPAIFLWVYKQKRCIFKILSLFETENREGGEDTCYLTYILKHNKSLNCSSSLYTFHLWVGFMWWKVQR